MKVDSGKLKEPQSPIETCNRVGLEAPNLPEGQRQIETSKQTPVMSNRHVVLGDGEPV